MGAKIQAFDIFQTPLSSHYPLALILEMVKNDTKIKDVYNLLQESGSKFLKFLIQIQYMK
jgi:hypothetical protein